MTETNKAHFLLTSKARTFSISEIARMTDAQARQYFKELRWGKGEEVACPQCASYDKHYFIRTRKQWRCKDCNHSFSVTSGTIFAHHKLPLQTYLLAIALYSNAAKGISSLQLCRDLNVNYKTAFVLTHKIRESIFKQRDERPLSGEVHIDGAYINTKAREKNKKEDRLDRRLEENQHPDKRCIFMLCEKHPEGEGVGTKRSLSFILKSENQADVNRIVSKYVKKGSTICADKASAYNVLHAKFDTKRVNHDIEYMSDEGVTNNLAESSFSRFRRMQYGQMHKFSTIYLEYYSTESSYRENTRRWPNGSIFFDIVEKCITTKTSHDLCGYWQGNKKQAIQC